ncbi:MAG: helix-turn-helix domain-containing protein [Patescibacteria group bacterium]
MEFQELLSSKIKESGLDIKKLSESSGIAEKHLENIITGNYSSLPAAPYLRGYFIKLGQILNVSGEELWKLFKEESEISSSGAKDRLPENRFTGKSSPKKTWIIVVVVVVIATYFGLRFSKILGKPSLTIYYPEENLTTSSSSEIVFRGELRGGDKVTINVGGSTEEVPVNDEGLWFKKVVLGPGLNVIEIKGKKFLGLETKTIRQVSYEPRPKVDGEDQDNPKIETETPATSTD